jgi:hypothetical protein
MIKAKTQSFIALAYFLIASSLGIILRLFTTTNINFTYKYVVHTHSHIALLGWVYIALTSLIFHVSIKKKAVKKYSIIFWGTQITILGMLFSFPFIGYALFSILFSTLFLICSYWFFSFFKKHHHLNKNNYGYKFINTALLFMTISSIGPWALGIIMNTLGNTSHWYKNAIYFYLHFQYNGWFIFCLFGLLFLLLEKHQLSIQKKMISTFYTLMILSCGFTLFLSFLWIKPPVYIYELAFIGAFLQLFALYKLHQIIKTIQSILYQKLPRISILLLRFIYILFIFKIVSQTLTAFPYFAELAIQIKDFVIGYLHLTFLGIVSLSLFVFLKEFGQIKISNFWMHIYLQGFILSEILIFYKGICIWQQLAIVHNYSEILIIVSALIPIGVLGMFIQNTKPILSTQKEFL